VPQISEAQRWKRYRHEVWGGLGGTNFMGELGGGKQEAQDKGEKLSVLQQHFKRKVKENTLQSDLLKKQKMESMASQNRVSTLDAEIKKLNASLEMQKLHDEKIQKMTKEALSTAEERSKEWQEKYFVSHEKWQNGNIKIKELEKVQSEYQQVQEFLTKMRQFAGAGIVPSAQQATPFIENIAHEADNESFVEGIKVNLEDRELVEEGELLQTRKAKVSSRPKNSLFDD